MLFLNGFLKETVFAEQPPGFINTQFPSHVCYLKRALYGLKQAIWFERLSMYLLSLSFIYSKAMSSLFISKSSYDTLLIYIDDITVTDLNPSISSLTPTWREFSLNDLGNLHYFLRNEVFSRNDRLFFNQTRYAIDSLDCKYRKPLSTLLQPHHNRHKSTDSLFSKPSSYRSIVGALQYLTNTRPDLTYVVNLVCQYMYAHSSINLQVDRLILRYIKCTIIPNFIFIQQFHASLGSLMLI